MKLYRLNGVYYEKQAEVPKGQGKFEVIDFSFAASPKADFVQWINLQEQLKTVDEIREEIIDEEQSAPPPPPVQRDVKLETREHFQEAWDTFPLPLQLHYATLALEEARDQIKPKESSNG